jgi:hypothetical protein
MDTVVSMRETAQELISVAQRRAIDFAPLRNDAMFRNDRRSIFVWRKVDGVPASGPALMKEGTLCYNMQGSIKVLPNVLKDSAGAFKGGWSESGTFENLEQAVDFVKAWLVERKEIDELPRRCVRSYYI